MLVTYPRFEGAPVRRRQACQRRDHATGKDIFWEALHKFP